MELDYERSGQELEKIEVVDSLEPLVVMHMSKHKNYEPIEILSRVMTTSTKRSRRCLYLKEYKPAKTP